MKEATAINPEHAPRQVLLSINAKLALLQGAWSWDLHSAAVYCSDVMAFSQNFEGTKGIIHPEDLEKLKAALSLLPEMTIGRLSFRMITTFGEIKELVGSQVQLSEIEPWMAEQYETAENWEARLRNQAQQKETTFLRLRNSLADTSERHADAGSWYINKVSGETWYSDNMYRLHGVPPQSLNAHPHTFNIFIHPEDKVVVQEAFEQAFSGELPLHLDYRIIRPGGEWVWVRQITYWGFNNQGQPVLGGLLRSLQEAQQLQAQLEASDLQLRIQQQVLQQAEKQSQFGYWIMNLVTRKTNFSAAYLRIHGLKTGTVATQSFFLNLVHPDDKALVAERMKNLNKTHELPETEYRIIRPDGKVRYLQLSGKLSVFANNELVMVAVANDITARKAQEQTLQELNDTVILQNNTLLQMEEVGELASLVLFPDGSMRWSDGLYRLLGYRPKSVEPLLVIWRKSVHPADLKVFNDNFNLLLNEQLVAPFSFRVITRTGVRLVVLSFSSVTEQGRVAMVGILQDLTHRQDQERQSGMQERYNRLLEDVSKDILIYTNTENTILGWNAAAVAKTGIEKEKAIGANLFDCLPALRSETFLAQLNAALEGREVQVQKGRFQYLPGPQSFQLSPHLDESGTVHGVLHLVQDIARELDLQQQLSERLSFIESLVDASVDRIVVLDKHMNYLYWNPRAEAY
ncbi:PAS domain S-box-containing protein [Cnuella takakiae]|uniref:histidine kinase n=1 Tax=Cnuella takakiae TaxID=1302690 RepID=A0A1M4WFU0_9BACT|nr:PAS domain S-box-containing protein [Cnuella takakiae]